MHAIAKLTKLTKQLLDTDENNKSSRRQQQQQQFLKTDKERGPHKYNKNNENNKCLTRIREGVPSNITKGTKITNLPWPRRDFGLTTYDFRLPTSHFRLLIFTSSHLSHHQKTFQLVALFSSLQKRFPASACCSLPTLPQPS